MSKVEEDRAQEFIGTLEFGDVFGHNASQLVFLHRDEKNSSPDCLLVIGDVNGVFSLNVCGTITLGLVIPQVISRLSLVQLEQHFEPWYPPAKDDLLAIIRNWAR